MATNYKKLKWGTNTPDIVKWNTATPEYPGLVKWGNTVVFARAADISSATKTNITSITLALTSYAVPSGQSRANGYFWGDVIRATPTPAQWWVVSPTYADITVKDQIDTLVSTSPATYYARDLFTASRQPREVYVANWITDPQHKSVAQVQLQYADLNNTIITTTTSEATVSAWAGALVTMTGAGTLWDYEGVLYNFDTTEQYGVSHTFAKGDTRLDIRVKAVVSPRNLTIHKTDPMSQFSAITATYIKVVNPHKIEADTQPTTVSVPTNTASSFYDNLFKNSIAELSATVNSTIASYIDLTITSINAGASSADCEFTVKAEPKTRTLKYIQDGDVNAFKIRTFIFKDIENGAYVVKSPTSSTEYSVWQGEDMWSTPVYTFVANDYYSISVVTAGNGTGSGIATVMATGSVKYRTLNIGAFPFGMSKFSWSTTSDSGSTTITIGTSASLKQPYTYNYSVTSPSPDYFNITMTPTKNEPGDTNITVNFSSTGKTRNYRVYWTDRITSVTGQYISDSWITTNYAPTIPGSGAYTYTNVWRGAGITVNATAADYYTPEYATTNMDAGIHDAACTITAAATPRKVRVAFAGSYTVALASVTVNFASVGATGTAKNYHPTSSTNYTEVWAGSDVTTTAQANQYFNIDVDKPTITKDTAAGDATVNISGSYAYRSWTIATKSGYQNINTHSFSYIKTTNPDVVTTATSYATYNRVWQGGKCTINATAASYWTPVVWEGLTSHSGSSDTYTYEFAESTNNIISSLGAARRPRNLKVNLHETDSRVSRALSAVTVVYKDTSDNFQTVNPTTSTTYIAWSGYAITASATSKDYASVTVTSTDWAAGYTDAIVDVTCTLASRQAVISIIQNDDSCISNMTLTYVKSDTGAGTAVSPAQAGTYYYVWQGAAVNLYVGLLNNYYTYSVTSYNQGASSSTASFYVYASARARYVSGTFTSISKVSASSTEHNVDITGSGYYLRQPYAYDFTVTPAQYWKNATVSPTQVAAGSTTVTLTLSAERETRYLFVDVYNRDRGAGTITATYGGTSSSVSTSVSISGTTTNTNSGLLSAWQGEAVTYTYSVTDSTNYTMVVTSSGTAIGTTNATITANIYGKTVQHTLSVWPSGLGTWYTLSSITNSLSVSRNSPMTYGNWTGTLRTATISAKSLGSDSNCYVQCTLNYVLMSLSTKPTLGPTMATTFTAYIGKPITLTLSNAEAAYYGCTAKLTYYPTFGVCSQSTSKNMNTWVGSTSQSLNGAQNNSLVFTRKSSSWTMVINGTNRTSTSYTVSNTTSNTTVTVDAYRNTTFGMSYMDGWHADTILDTSDGTTATATGTLYNDTNKSITFTLRLTGEYSGGEAFGTDTDITVPARSSQYFEMEYNTGGDLEYFELLGKCPYESNFEQIDQW